MKHSNVSQPSAGKKIFLEQNTEGKIPGQVVVTIDEIGLVDSSKIEHCIL